MQKGDKEIENKLKELIELLNRKYGWFNEEELKNTPRRIARFYEEWLNNKEFSFTTFDKETNQLIILKDIDFYSLCSHHLLPFFGKAHIGYLPDKRICGISKLARVVKKFASKPQIQERMTEEIADYIFRSLDAKFVMVIVEAQHLCMLMRGVKQHSSKMTTSAVRCRDDMDMISLKQEFLRLIGR